MSFCLLPNKVYATIPTNLGVVIFQPVGGDIQLFGTNVTKHFIENGKNLIVPPKFEDMIKIWDDYMQKDTVNPMNCLTNWIGFTSPTPEAVVWVNGGINLRITPVDEIRV